MTIQTERDVPGFAEHETGSHRIQRVPPTEKRGRVHTSTVTVAILKAGKRNPVYDLRGDNDFAYRWFSGSGAGGQHRNKHQNCLELTHIPTGIKRSCQGRSREANIRDAMAEMELILDAQGDEQKAQEQNDFRANQIGSGGRGDVKRRTYRFQEDSVVDHETGRKTSCKQFMRGNIEALW